MCRTTKHTYNHLVIGNKRVTKVTINLVVYRARRDNVRQVLLIATDGDYTNFAQTIAAKNALITANPEITIFTIGVGVWFTRNQGNVDALATRSEYHANSSVWLSLTEDAQYMSNYDNSKLQALELHSHFNF